MPRLLEPYLASHVGDEQRFISELIGDSPRLDWNAAGFCAFGPGHPKGETHMRKVLFSLAALAVFGLALPAANTSASAETVVIKKHRDHGWHHGWRHRDRVVVREHRRRGVIVREGRRHHGVGVVVR